jgi:MerR family transcriptional regulator, redox-sensitive transcriptional activator SoxR
MPGMTISEVARQAGLPPSTLRYYEQIGIVPPPPRAGGQRRYDTSALDRLAVVQRARQVGFTLQEIRRLFFGFDHATPASARWRELTDRKLAELDVRMDDIRSMQRLLQRMQKKCRCSTLEQCGNAMRRRA